MLLSLLLVSAGFFMRSWSIAFGLASRMSSVVYVILYPCRYIPLNYTQVLSLPPVVAPTKVLVVPLSARDEFAPIVQEICKLQLHLITLT